MIAPRVQTADLVIHPNREVHHGTRVAEQHRDERVHPPDLFDSAFLVRLQTIHRELEETVPYLADIDSLVSLFGVGRPARSTEGRAVSTMPSS